MTKTIMISGGFDPCHIGHVRMMKAAAQYGDVIVAVNSDEWLIRKKGYVFMPREERMEIIRSFKWVDRVVPVLDKDDTVCKTISFWRPDFFGNGGDRKSDNTPEVSLCEKYGIELVWNLGGGKIQSSSELVEKSKYFKDGEVK